MILGIYGSGGLGREIFDIANRINKVSHLWEIIIFIDDISQSNSFYGTAKVKFEEFLELTDKREVIIAVGEPKAREKLFEKVREQHIAFATLIDPTAILSPTASIEAGVIICEYSTIHANVTISENCLIQPFCNIGHDIRIGKHTVLSSFCAPGGSLTIGNRVYIGMQSAIIENLTIEDDAIIGMGSVVYRDVLAGSTVLGNPARVTKGNEGHKVFK